MTASLSLASTRAGVSRDAPDGGPFGRGSAEVFGSPVNRPVPAPQEAVETIANRINRLKLQVVRSAS